MRFGLETRRILRTLLAAAALFSVGCTSYPNRPVVSEVELEEIGEGAEGADPDAALEGLATGSSSGFLFFWREYDIYDETVLARDLERVERYYRARGYYEAKVTAARVIRVDEHKVRIQIRVDPGAMTTVRTEPVVLGLTGHLDVFTEVLKAITLHAGDRFDEQAFEDSKAGIEKALGDGGLAFAKIKAKAKVDIKSHVADIEFNIEPGQVARYGEIEIEGLSELPEEKVRSALRITKGQQYSRAELAEAERALQDLNVFAGIEIRQDRSRPESGEVPIQLVLREGKLRGLKLGGGARFDVLRLSTHLRTGWEHKNFLGGMRHFEIEAKPGLTWYPLRLGNFEYGLQKVLPEGSVTAELRQPSFVLPRLTGILRAEYNAYPLLYPLPEGVDPAKETIIGYHEFRALAGVEYKWYFDDDDITFRPFDYNWQANFPFAYQNENTVLDTVNVPFLEVSGEFKFNLRPIPVDIQFLTSVQFAGLVLSDNPNWVSDIRFKPEVRVQLDVLEKGKNKKLKGKLILAGRLGFGFLIPASYGQSLNPRTEEGAEAEVDPTDPDVIRNQQKLLFRAFYSGGPSSNRGYPYRGVGPHGPVGFLIPTGLNCSLTGRAVEDLPEGCIRPLGGFTLWEASFEVRYNFAEPLGAVVFIDASDVTRDVAAIRLNVPHLSVGPGLRYTTPVGALRFDVGYRIPGAQALGQSELEPEDGRPGTEFFGVLPITLQLAIGEAF